MGPKLTGVTVRLVELGWSILRQEVETGVKSDEGRPLGTSISAIWQIADSGYNGQEKRDEE
jgi:hypothetical protein